MAKPNTPQVPTVKFDSNVTEVIKRLTAAFNNLKRINEVYGLEPDETFVFNQNSFDEFVRKVCEEHFGRIYSKKGISKTFIKKINGDFLDAIIASLGKRTSSERLKILVSELKKSSAR